VEIAGLVVDSAQRQKGIGKMLVVAVESWALSRSVKSVTVRTNVTRPESHRFYERMGYALAKTQHVYRKSIPAD
jgi:GNAT superfamily N-acetyltransferase